MYSDDIGYYRGVFQVSISLISHLYVVALCVCHRHPKFGRFYPLQPLTPVSLFNKETWDRRQMTWNRRICAKYLLSDEVLCKYKGVRIGNF